MRMSDIYATAMREKAKSPEQKQEEVEQRNGCKNLAATIAALLCGRCGGEIEASQSGISNVVVVVSCGREYRVTVIGGRKA